MILTVMTSIKSDVVNSAHLDCYSKRIFWSLYFII